MLGSRTTDRLLRLLCVCAMLAGSACAEESVIPATGEFSGQWSVTGEQQLLPFLDQREVTITRHRGEVNLRESGGLPGAFFSECLGFSDSGTGGRARCEWVDSSEDRLYIETESEVMGARRVVRGQIVGGTGKYAGIQGQIELEAWMYSAPNLEEQEINAFTDSLRGSWTFE